MDRSCGKETNILHIDFSFNLITKTYLMSIDQKDANWRDNPPEDKGLMYIKETKNALTYMAAWRAKQALLTKC